MASRAGIQGIPKLSAYVTSKAALIRFSEALALETIEDGIQVFAIHPGTLRTPMNDYVHDSPEVAKSAPWVQQRFRTVFAQGLDTPIERPVHLMLRLAAGDADALSGRYLSVDDDLDALVKQFAAEPSSSGRRKPGGRSAQIHWRLLRRPGRLRQRQRARPRQQVNA